MQGVRAAHSLLVFMKILAIETSCDETGLAVLNCTGPVSALKIKIEKELLTSQIDIHAHWGGVVPSLAKREHLKNLPLLLKKLSPDWKKIDLIAVTVGPGLEPALWAGIEFAKDLAHARKKPLLGVNHMEGHLFSVLLSQNRSKKQGERRKGKNSLAPRSSLLSSKLFPAIAIIVSGGHTMLLHLQNLGRRKLLGETRDDAAGEAFDKVARLLNLPYPGGPEISRRAAKGDPRYISFPQPMLHSKDYDFSFSGLKTAVLYYLRDRGYKYGGVAESARLKKKIPPKLLADVAASFEFAAVNVLAEKTFRAVREYGAKSVWLAGGVAANPLLRKTFESRAKEFKIPVLLPDMAHNTDNAAMIGLAAYLQKLRKKQLPIRAEGGMGM